MSVDGQTGVIDHVRATPSLVQAGSAAQLPLELLTRWRVVPDGSESWRVDVTVSNSVGPYGGGYAGWSFQHSSTFGTIVGAADTRADDPLNSGTNWWEFDRGDLPSPAAGIWLWARIYVDSYGAYVRFWPDGSEEPVLTAPLESQWGHGGRDERWHAYQETAVPKADAGWDRFWIDAGSSTSQFQTDHFEIVLPCQAPE